MGIRLSTFERMDVHTYQHVQALLKICCTLQNTNVFIGMRPLTLPFPFQYHVDDHADQPSYGKMGAGRHGNAETLHRMNLAVLLVDDDGDQNSTFSASLLT